ncbi:UNVERIFIED_CONTAM: hypothetical protein GTU68_002385 [Idotea baltica]|nr:hypothetical protein [Idotea baltica]
MASYCDARLHNGTWRLRLDDIDPPREMADAAKQIPRSLNTYGFNWDGNIINQSMRTAVYRQHLLELNEKSALFLCACTRKELAGCAIYPGNCRTETNSHTKNLIKNKIIDNDVNLNDLIQGNQFFIAGEHFGDTVLARRDDLFSYALCCAIDDADGITHVIRGSDLLPTTGVQVRLMQLLALPIPQYAHIPVALNSEQQKLSKQTLAEPIDEMPVLATLLRAWQFLGQTQLNVHSVDAFWQAAFAAWQISLVPKCMSQAQ